MVVAVAVTSIILERAHQRVEEHRSCDAQLERWLAVFERLHADGPALDAPRAKDGALCEEATHYILQASLRPRPS